MAKHDSSQPAASSAKRAAKPKRPPFFSRPFRAFLGLSLGAPILGLLAYFGVVAATGDVQSAWADVSERVTYSVNQTVSLFTGDDTQSNGTPNMPNAESIVIPEDPAALNNADWEAFLSPLEYRVLRHSATERPGTGRYLDNDADEAGQYHCVGCGHGLYPATHKFHSGCGWPSFFEEVNADAITTVEDTSHGMVRVEMRCANCEGHLGHIFNDAPDQPTGKRHCVNGAALIFVPDSATLQETLAAHRALVRAGDVE